MSAIDDLATELSKLPGIGRKTASFLFTHFESLQQLYDDLDRVLKLKLRNAEFVCAQLRDYRERAFLARQLTEIACNMPLDIGFDGLRRRSPDLAALQTLYDAVNFGPMLRMQAGRILDRAA